MHERRVSMPPAQASLGAILMALSCSTDLGYEGAFCKLHKIGNFRDPRGLMVGLCAFHTMIANGQEDDAKILVRSSGGNPEIFSDDLKDLDVVTDERGRILTMSMVCFRGMRHPTVSVAQSFRARLQEWGRQYPAMHHFFTTNFDGDELAAAHALENVLAEWRAHSTRQQFALV